MNETRASVENFDLDRHAVVEASAGTGKTYTIEKLVLRLVTEEEVPIEQILVVTFAEKATGELKVRLRGMLDNAVQKDDEFTPLAKRAFDHFDQAPIFTIHGFCQRLLQEYALEQGQDFHASLVNDNDLLESSLREIQRKTWRTYFGDHLKAVLDKAMYNRETADVWDRKVLDIAKSFKPRCGHQLRPAFVSDWWQRLEEPGANWAGQLEIFTIDAIHQHLRDFKRQRGLQSFDDMIAAVEENLDPVRNPGAADFLDVLRARYRHGIVDEFQDTDPLQWRIFRRIFLEGGTSKLFVVGDPKQAIFGFRGADLPTYLDAVRQMTAEFDASEYPLLVNWRSDPDLLEGLNCLFQDGEWFPRETGIDYRDVHAPDDDQRLTRTADDRTNRAALTIVDLSQWGRLKAAQKNYARFVANEIQHLLSSGHEQPMFSFALKSSEPRPLNASDICILISKRFDAEPIMQALELAGIPYSFFKQTGLWKSEEAIHLEMLLRTLAHPDDSASFRKALLTCFFRVKAVDLIRVPDVPMQHPARELFQAWLGFAENRQWSALCRSLLEDTGLLFLARDDADRRVTNLRHILTTLEQAGYGLNLDLLGLLDWLRHEKQEPSEADVRPIEMGPKVKIMTIHASKGLEFPVVFLAGGFTRGRDGGSFASYHDAQHRTVFDLIPDAAALELVNAERLSEQRRLFYVALTRPIFKLYVPKVKLTNRSKPYAGPVGSILLPALEQACPDKLGPMIADVVTPPLATSVPQLHDQTPVEKAVKPIRLDGPLFPPIDNSVGRRRIVTRSFSSMTKHHLTHVGEGSSFGEQPLAVADETEAPLDREDPLRGPVFGDMVHKVLEAIDFAEVGRAAAPDDLLQARSPGRKLIDQHIKNNIAMLRTRTPIDQLEQACRQQIANLVWHALRTPSTALGGPLYEIPQGDRLSEVGFLFPERPGEPAPADQRPEEGFVTGYMDLLFRKDEKFYLLDWKTNLLSGYSRDQIERSMADAEYDRQYRLYVYAVRRWLERVAPGVAFLKQFGGVFYLYVRGLNGKDETTGVYFHRPTERELDLASLLK